MFLLWYTGVFGIYELNSDAGDERDGGEQADS